MTDVFYVSYGGDPNSEFLVEVPEPATLCLCLLPAICVFSLKRWRKS